MKKILNNIKDWIWNALFLDFYLDKNWSFRFKLMNLISGDTARTMLMAWSNLKDIDVDENRELVINDSTYSGIDHEGVRGVVAYRVRRAQWELCSLYNYYHKGE